MPAPQGLSFYPRFPPAVAFLLNAGLSVCSAAGQRQVRERRHAHGRPVPVPEGLHRNLLRAA